MKKLYLLLFTILIAGYVNSQSLNFVPKKAKNFNLKPIKNFHKQGSHLKNLVEVSEWFNYALEWQDSLQPSNNMFEDLLFPDSMAVYNIGDEYYNSLFYALGVVLDPFANVYGKQKIKRGQAYKVDTIALYCQYFRNHTDTNIVDTLIVELISNFLPPYSSITGGKDLYPPYKDDEIFFSEIVHDSKLNFDKTTSDYYTNLQYGENIKASVITKKIPLTKANLADTIPGTGGIMAIVVPTPNAPTDTLYRAATFRFKPGYEYKQGDTISNKNLLYFFTFQERGLDKFPFYYIEDFSMSSLIHTLSLAYDIKKYVSHVEEYNFFAIDPFPYQNHLVDFKLSYKYCPCDLAFDTTITKTINCGQSTELKTNFNTCNTNIKYKWAPTTTLSSSTIANPIASPKTTTTYTVTATADGCKSVKNIKITVNPINVSAGLTRNINCGDTVHINTKVLPEGSSYSYKWSPVTGLSSSTIANPIASPTNTTTYKVTVTDGACTATDNLQIVVKSIKATASQERTIVCGDTVHLNVSADMGSGFTYNWAPEASLNQNTIKNPVASPSETTNYSVTITSDKGCNANASTKVNVGYDYDVEFSSPQTTYNSNPPYNVSFVNETPGMSNYNFTWDFGDGNIEDNNSGTVNHTYELNGKYTIKLIAKHKSITACIADSIIKTGYILCKSGNSVSVGAIVVTPDTLKIPKGATSSFNVNILPNTATNKTVLWKSSNSNIAFIEPNGTVTGLNYGHANISVVTVDGGFKSDVVVKVYNPVNIREQKQNELNCTYYPNPFTDKCIVKYSNSEYSNVTIKLFDFTGKEIQLISNGYKSKGEHSFAIDAKGLANGIYYFNITTGKKSFTGKISKVE